VTVRYGANPQRIPGRDAIAVKGWLRAHKWLIARRSAQAGFLAIFMTGPLFGLWITKGTLAASMTFDVLPLTDPFVALQAFLAGQVLATTGLIGAAIVLAVYAVLGGRLYCSWVCPLNVVTDAAHWLREKLHIGKGWQPNRNVRFCVLGAALAVSTVFGTIAWELVNPVTMLHRGIVFGSLFSGLSIGIVAAVFVFDLFVSRRGWCGHLCPVGTFYRLAGQKSIIKVSAANRVACDDCMECYAVCPEPHVLPPALRHGTNGGGSPLVQLPDCTLCGRCIDVCPTDVFRMTHQFDFRETCHAGAAPKAAALAGSWLKEA